MADKVKKDVAGGDKTFDGTIDDIVKKLLDDAEAVESGRNDDTRDNVTMARIYRDLAQHVRDAHDKEMRVLAKRLNDVARHLEFDITKLRYENDRLRFALDLERDVSCRHMCHDLQIESRIWGQMPEIALTLTRRKFDGMPGYDKYRLNLMIQNRPTTPIVMNLALDTVLRLFRFAITGEGGPADQLLKKD